MGSITSHWSTLKQNGIFIAILSSFLQVQYSCHFSPMFTIFALQIAPIFTMPVSGELCTSSLGWPSVYYLHGLVSLLLFTMFMLVRFKCIKNKLINLVSSEFAPEAPIDGPQWVGEGDVQQGRLHLLGPDHCQCAAAQKGQQERQESAVPANVQGHRHLGDFGAKINFLIC